MEDGINSVGEEENDSKGAADVVDSWVRSMMKKLDPNHCKFSPFVICKVHRDIRKDDNGAYTPKIVSIGPFHRREENVQAMEELKRHCLNNILPSDDGDRERCLKVYLEEMKEIEPFVRSCYSEKIDMDPQEFVEMMVVDGFFLIQLLFQMGREKKYENPIYNNYWRLPLIRHDILLLENQLPFFVLERLCRLIGGDYERTLWKQALDFYERLLPEEDHAKRKKPGQIYHLLHLIHMFFRPAASALPQNTPGRSSTPPNQKSPQTTVCGSAWISALIMGRRSPTPPGEQSSQEIEYTPSSQQSSLEVPLIYASTLKGSAPTHSITIDCMPPTPPGEQSAQELQHTLSGEQSSLQACIRSGKHQFELAGSAPIYPITRPTASRGKQSSQELKHSPSSNIFSELSGSSPIYPRTKPHTPLAGSAPINPKTKGSWPPGVPGKQSSQELQHTQSGRPVTTHLRPPISPVEQSSQDAAEEDESFAEEGFSICAAADPRTFTESYPETTVLPRPISQGEQSSQDPAEEDDPFAKQDIPWSQRSFKEVKSMCAAADPSTCTEAVPVITLILPRPISQGEQSSQDPAEEDDHCAEQDIPSNQQSFVVFTKMSAAAESCTFIEDYPEITFLPPPISQGEQSSQDPAEQDNPSGQQYTREVTCAPPVGASGNTQSKQCRRQARPKTIPSAKELQEAGLTFQKKETDNFLDVTFKPGKLEMPPLCIDDSTNSLFRNFIAFEQCFPYWGCHFTSYCFFMDSLVNTAKDVGILRKNHVIENLLGSDDDVALLFNKLCKGVFINFYDGYLNEVVKKMEEHGQNMWPKYRAKLMRDYFSNPWSMISVAAASLIIVLTLVQTVFTVFA